MAIMVPFTKEINIGDGRWRQLRGIEWKLESEADEYWTVKECEKMKRMSQYWGNWPAYQRGESTRSDKSNPINSSRLSVERP